MGLFLFFDNLFQYASSLHSYNTRYKSKLFHPFVLRNFYFWNTNSRLQARYETMFLSHICDISNMLILLADIFYKVRRTYAVLYCRPSNQSFLDKIWLVSAAQCLSIVRGTLQQYLQKMNFQQKSKWWSRLVRPF